MQLRQLYTIISFFTIFVALAFINGIAGVFQFAIFFLFYALLAYALASIFRKIRRKQRKDFLTFFKDFSYRISIILTITGIAIWGFIWYQNIYHPAKLPLYTITNGEKMIKFETMSHIASPLFYENVEGNIRQAKLDGYVLFYEGVGGGSDENIEKFSDALGIDITPTLYSTLSELYGITAQNNADFLNIVNNKDYNVDLTIDEVMEIYEKNTETQTVKRGDQNSLDTLQFEDEIASVLSDINPRELAVMRAINQAILNFMIKHGGLRDTIIENLGSADIFSVILDDRNKYLVDSIVSSDEQKIFITYGLMHFEGVLELLQASDPNWHITQTQEFQVIFPGS